METGGPRDALQSARIAAEAAAGGIDDGVAAGEPEAADLGDGRLLVEELAVVAAEEWVVAEES